MTPGIVISNASPLIALEQTGQLALLEQLFAQSILIHSGSQLLAPFEVAVKVAKLLAFSKSAAAF